MTTKACREIETLAFMRIISKSRTRLLKSGKLKLRYSLFSGASIKMTR